jgi:hypothetical protein
MGLPAHTAIRAPKGDMNEPRASSAERAQPEICFPSDIVGARTC